MREGEGEGRAEGGRHRHEDPASGASCRRACCSCWTAQLNVVASKALLPEYLVGLINVAVMALLQRSWQSKQGRRAGGKGESTERPCT